MDRSALTSLLEDAAELSAEPLQAEPRRLAELARRALSLGHPLLACEWLLARHALCQADPQLSYLLALAEVRIGGYREAVRWLAPLLDSADDDLDASLRVDAQSLAGRIAKDCWQRLPKGAARDKALDDAVTRYRQAWEESRDPFPGINAASLLRLRGDEAGSRLLATAVARRIESAADTLQPHWREATLGEAMLLLGRAQDAAGHYADAVRLAKPRHGDIAAMRRQLALLAAVLPEAVALRSVMRLPAVFAFTGHMVDPPGASRFRFPASLESAVADSIHARLHARNAGVGFCSAACGGDLLFIEAMLAQGAEVNVILPFERGDFVATSVAPGGEAWVRRFEEAMQRVNRVEYAVPERHLGDDALYAHAGRLIQGAARLRARDFDDEPRLLAVVDAGGGGGPGGSLDTVTSWSRVGLQVDTVDLAALRGPGDASASPTVFAERAVAENAAAPNSLHREVRSMLFADVVGYSKLSEEHTPAFLVGFLRRVAGLVDAMESRPELVNTWGDGLFMVFRDVVTAADFALSLRDMIASVDWTAEGLPTDIRLRIGLHVGPVYPAEDPLLHRPNVFGTQVTRAARIEPIAAADSVFISAEAAYALAADNQDRLCADYLGTLPLAKDYGSQPMYRLRRASDMA
ncbi:MAG: TRAFs-binding domain-containing protein [Lysobacteraceae bacterium]